MRISRVLVLAIALSGCLLLAGSGVPAGAQTSTNTVYIWPGNLYQGNTSGNGLNLAQVGTGTFAIVPGPSTPPLGNASAQFTLGPGPGTGRVDIWANQFAGTELSSITAMSYSTFLGPDESASFAPSYQLPIFGTPGGPTSTFTTLSFMPTLQGVAIPVGWSTWDVLMGKWTASNANLSSRIPGGCLVATPCTFSQITSAFPDAVLHGVDPTTGIGGVGLIVGTGVGMGVGVANDWTFGVNGVTTVFDFHTAPPPEGYLLTASDGGVFAFGTVAFQGLRGGHRAGCTGGWDRRIASGWLLAGVLRRDGVHARDDVVRINGWAAPQRTHRRHSGHCERRWLLSCGGRRRGVRLR